MKKIKEFLKKIREAWKEPRKKAGIKLLMYFIFFFILFILMLISNSLSSNNDVVKNDEVDSTILNQDSKYNDKKDILLTDKFNIKYDISYLDKSYVINGILNSNVINGYLEYDNSILKVIYDDKLLDSNSNTLDLFDVNYINLEYILNILGDKSFILDSSDDNKVYTYNFDIEDKVYNYVVYANSEYVNKIEIKFDNNKYVLSFDKIS